MATGRQIQQKKPSNSTPNPATGIFKPRPFATPAELEAVSAPELQQTTTELGQVGGSRLSRIDVSAPPPIQPKLTLGAPGDKFEREADTIADTVMRMPAVSAPTPVTNPTPQTPPAQAKPIAATITPVASSAQMQPEPLASAIEEEQESAKKGRIQRWIRVQAAGDGSLDAPSSLETQLNQTKNSGSPLSPEIRAQMEPRFGADFSGVRVHTDAPAVQMNQELGAQAFTHGNHIYYGEGKFPGNDHLTAHELTHTIQQSGSSVIQRYTDDNVDTQSQKASQQAKQLETSRQQKRGQDLNQVREDILKNNFTHDLYWAGDELKNFAVNNNKSVLSLSSAEAGDFNLVSALGYSLMNFWKSCPDYESRKNSIKISTPEEITNANTTIQQVLKCLYHLEDNLTQTIGSIKSEKFAHSKYLMERLRSYVTWVKGKYENHYRVVSDSTVDSKELKYLVTQDSINSILLTRVASAIESAVPMNGSATFKFNLKIPLKPPFFVGLGLEVEAERQENQFKLRVEAVLEGGVQIWGVEFKGSVGFYSEAQADNAYNAIKLISYGFYRKALESSVVPNKLTYAIWSGETNDPDKAKWIVDAWEAKLRGEVVDKVKDSYVDTGDLVKATLGAKDEDSEAGFELSSKHTSGRKHSTLSYQGESTSKHVVELKISAASLGTIGLKISKGGDETEMEVSYETKAFSEITNAVVAFADYLVPTITKLQSSLEFAYIYNSLKNIYTAAKNIENSAITPEESSLKDSQSVKFIFSFTEQRSQGSYRITKGGLKIMRMKKDEYGKKSRSAELSVEFETASRLMELSYDNGKWELKSF